MRIFVIPSWFPSISHPSAGIFFSEQTELYARYFPEDQLGLVNWGQNDHRLLLEKSGLFSIPEKLLVAGAISRERDAQADNFVKWFIPTFTWTRKLFHGNIGRIIKACDKAFSEFTDQFGEPEIMHAHVGYPGGYIAWKLSEKYKIPFVITEHMGPFPFQDFLKDSGSVDSKLLDPLIRANQTLAVSTHLHKEMKRYGIPSEVFHNFIDDDFFDVGAAFPEQGKVRLLHIGRLAPEKRQADLLKALNLIPSTIDFELSVAGDGPLMPELKEKVNELNLKDRITFHGNLNRVEIREQIQHSDLMILSSSYENFPVSILEALACGRPVVATKCGGPEEMINETNGLLVNPADPKDLALKIEIAVSDLDRYDSRTIRSDFMKRFGRQNALQELRKVYQETIARYHDK